LPEETIILLYQINMESGTTLEISDLTHKGILCGGRTEKPTSREIIKYKKMLTTILSYEVKDYKMWRKVFDENATNRNTLGVNVTGLYRSVDNPKLISIICEASTENSMKEFMNHQQSKLAFEKSGVIGKPEVKLLNKIA
jgi:hypothetical protein